MKLLNRKKEPTKLVFKSDLAPNENLIITSLPQSCMPGGENAEAYQDAYAVLLGAQSEEEVEAAHRTLRELGVVDQLVQPA